MVAPLGGQFHPCELTSSGSLCSWPWHWERGASPSTSRLPIPVFPAQRGSVLEFLMDFVFLHNSTHAAVSQIQQGGKAWICCGSQICPSRHSQRSLGRGWGSQDGHSPHHHPHQSGQFTFLTSHNGIFPQLELSWHFGALPKAESLTKGTSGCSGANPKPLPESPGSVGSSTFPTRTLAQP